MKPQTQGLLLDHLYVPPRAQGKGIGSAVPTHVFVQADATGVPFRVGALRDSESNRFYVRHGFQLVKQGKFDNSNVRRTKIRDNDRNAAVFDVELGGRYVAAERRKGLGQRVRD